MIGVRGITGTETGIETETEIIVEVGGGMTSMTETEEEKDMGVQLGRAVRNEGLGLSNGIERGRRRSNLKMESVVLVGLRVEMYAGIFLLLVTILGSDVWFSFFFYFEYLTLCGVPVKDSNYNSCSLSYAGDYVSLKLLV